MDMMEVRRRVMLSMGKTSILDELFEVVDSVTPTEYVYELTFQCDNREGTYVLIAHPTGLSVAAQGSKAQLFESMYFQIRGRETKALSTGASHYYLKTPTSSVDMDYWSTSGTLGDNTVTLKGVSNNNFGFESGLTYYLLRVKSA